MDRTGIKCRMGGKMRIEEKIFENRKNAIGRWERGEVGRWDVMKN